MAQNQRRYDTAAVASALAALQANAGNVQRTARQLGVPAATLRRWARGAITPEVATVVDEKKGNLADELEAIAWKIVEALPGKIPDASLSQATIALGVAIDKARLLRGEATTISTVDTRADVAFTAGILADPAAADLATQLLERITTGPAAASAGGGDDAAT